MGIRSQGIGTKTNVWTCRTIRALGHGKRHVRLTADEPGVFVLGYLLIQQCTTELFQYKECY